MKSSRHELTSTFRFFVLPGIISLGNSKILEVLKTVGLRQHAKKKLNTISLKMKNLSFKNAGF